MSILIDTLPVTIMAATGTVMSATWSLAFFPPTAYERFLRRRSTCVPIAG
jgi:hypothetical protein